MSRAVRIVPSEQPEANLANLYNYPRPPPVVSTSLVTEPVTAVVTVSTEVTTPLTVTLGAREVLTEIVQPTTTVSSHRYSSFFLFFINNHYINLSKHGKEHNSKGHNI